MKAISARNSDFYRNIKHLRELKNKSQEQIAQKLNIERLRLSRLETGKAAHTEADISKFSAYYNIEASLLTMPHNEFLSKIRISNIALSNFRTVARSISESDDIYKKFKGEYLVYYASEDGNIIVNLLNMVSSCPDGVVFSMINSYSKSEHFCYDGLMFRVGRYLYFIGEQKYDTDYEMINISIEIPLTPKKSIMYGIITGVGVDRDRGALTAKAIAVVERSTSAPWPGLGDLKMARFPRAELDTRERRIADFDFSTISVSRNG